MSTHDEIISRTRKWIDQVVIGCNFCPFAARELRRNTILYQVEAGLSVKDALNALQLLCELMDKDESVETGFVIFSDGFKRFDEYLSLVAKGERHLRKSGYEGVYQVASFHPDYCFAGAPLNDPANYTNRSIYPMLHLLREEKIEQALLNYPNPENIPNRNIEFARAKGLEYMKALWKEC